MSSTVAAWAPPHAQSTSLYLLSISDVIHHKINQACSSAFHTGGSKVIHMYMYLHTEGKSLGTRLVDEHYLRATLSKPLLC